MNESLKRDVIRIINGAGGHSGAVSVTAVAEAISNHFRELLIHFAWEEGYIEARPYYDPIGELLDDAHKIIGDENVTKSDSYMRLREIYQQMNRELNMMDY